MSAEQPPFYVTIGFLLGLVVFGTALVRGLWANLLDVTGQSRWIKDRRGNRKPDSVLDEAIRAMVRNIGEHPEQWKAMVVRDTGDRYNGSGEQIWRQDDQVQITDYREADYLTIRIENLGRFWGHELKPEVRDLLWRTCQGYKNYLAAAALLKPKVISNDHNDSR